MIGPFSRRYDRETKVPYSEISDPSLIPQNPVVSVGVTTFNHEAYISGTIEGVLMQKTEFPIELVIGEDCSTDKTREIVLDYQSKHPKTIRVLVSERNVGAMRNYFRTMNTCRGKYLALCEGDDYWTDPDKLRKQVAFLNDNTEYSMCSHAVETVFLGGVQPHKPFVEPLKSATFEEIVDRGRFIPTPSIVSRSTALPELPAWFLNLSTGHLPHIYMVTQSGKNYHFDEVMAVKRKHPKGITQDPIWSAKAKQNKLENLVYFYRKLNVWSGYKNKKVVYREIAKCCKRLFARRLKNGDLLETTNYAFLMLVYATLWQIARK